MLPARLRARTPPALRDDPRLRALALSAGLIPPRTMHSADDAGVLARAAAGARRVVEIGVYEGSSAVALCALLARDAELHLIDPFGAHADALPAGWGATERATRRVVARAVRRHDGPRVTWHVARSQDVAREWSRPLDLVFIDGDHSAEGVTRDWEQWTPHVVAGGHVVLHDARADRPGGRGLPGPTALMARLRGEDGIGFQVVDEADRTVALRAASRPGRCGTL